MKANWIVLWDTVTNPAMIIVSNYEGSNEVHNWCVEKIKNDREKMLQFGVTIKGDMLLDLGKQKCQEVAKESIAKEHKKFLRFNKLK